MRFFIITLAIFTLNGCTNVSVLDQRQAIAMKIIYGKVPGQNEVSPDLRATNDDSTLQAALDGKFRNSNITQLSEFVESLGGSCNKHTTGSDSYFSCNFDEYCAIGGKKSTLNLQGIAVGDMNMVKFGSVKRSVSEVDPASNSASSCATEAVKKESCEAKRGRWKLDDYGRPGLYSKWKCVLPAPDAGKFCLNSSDCSLGCVADAWKVGTKAEGMCAAFEFGGCRPEIVNGYVEGVLCYD